MKGRWLSSDDKEESFVEELLVLTGIALQRKVILRTGMAGP